MSPLDPVPFDDFPLGPVRFSAVPHIAGHQAGVFTLAQARTAGWSDAAIGLRRRRGDWRCLLGRGFVDAGAPVQRAAPIWAVHLTVPGAVISHLTAAHWHGFPVSDAEAARRRSVRGYAIARESGSPRQCRHPHIALSRARLPSADVRRHGGLLITSPVRTAIDTLALLPEDEGRLLWAWLSTRGRPDHTTLARAVDDRAGRPGTKRLRKLLAFTATGAASPAELLLHKLLRTAGITGWVANAQLLDRDGIIGVVDILFADARLIIEVDGMVAHADRRQFIADRRRQNRLVAAGYTVLRFTWHDLTTTPHSVLAHITGVLATKVTESAV